MGATLGQGWLSGRPGPLPRRRGEARAGGTGVDADAGGAGGRADGAQVDGAFIRTLEDYCSSQTAGLAESRGAGESPWRWALSAVAFEDGGRLDLKPVGCFLALSTSALSQRDPQVHKAARDTYEFILDLFTSALQEARELGEIRADVNVDEA
jgi:hypothetical protein